MCCTYYTTWKALNFFHILTHFFMLDSAAPPTAHLRAATAYAQRLCAQYYRHMHKLYLWICMRHYGKGLLCADFRLHFLLSLLLSSPLSYAYFVGPAISKKKMRRNQVVCWRNSINICRKFPYVQCVAKPGSGMWHTHSCWLLAPAYLLKALHCNRKSSCVC